MKNVLIISSEGVPFAKSGGLGDVIGALPKELKAQGVDTLIGLIASNGDAQRFYRNLLNAEINRGYGNSLFVTKRKEIIKKDKEGGFIPICTKNIFLKYYDTDGSSKTIWSKGNGDYAKYLMEIKDTSKDFITKEDEQYESEI